jgi:hypothetical protein
VRLIPAALLCLFVGATAARADEAGDRLELGRARAVIGIVRDAMKDRSPESEQAARQILAAELAQSRKLLLGSLADLERGGSGASGHLLRAERRRVRDLVEQLIESGKVRPERAAEFRAQADLLESNATALDEIHAAPQGPDRAARIAELRRGVAAGSARALSQQSQPTFRSFVGDPGVMVPNDAWQAAPSDVQ